MLLRYSDSTHVVVVAVVVFVHHAALSLLHLRAVSADAVYTDREHRLRADLWVPPLVTRGNARAPAIEEPRKARPLPPPSLARGLNLGRRLVSQRLRPCAEGGENALQAASRCGETGMLARSQRQEHTALAEHVSVIQPHDTEHLCYSEGDWADAKVSSASGISRTGESNNCDIMVSHRGAPCSTSEQGADTTARRIAAATFGARLRIGSAVSCLCAARARKLPRARARQGGGVRA